MIKRIETWIANIFKQELAVAMAEIAALRAEVTSLHAELKAHTAAIAKEAEAHVESVASGLKSHAVEVATELHAKVASDAKAIMHFQQTARLGCSWCGQLSRTYALEPAGKVKCADCQKKGVV